MKEFKNIQDIILKAEEIALKMEDMNEAQDRMRLSLNKVMNDNRQTVIRMDEIAKILPLMEKHVETIVTVANGLNAEKIRKEIDDSFADIDFEVNWEEVNENMNLRLNRFFKDMHLDAFAVYINSHISDYKAKCEQIDINIKKLKTINDAADRLGKQIPDLEHTFNRQQTKESMLQWSLIASFGVITGFILTYFFMQV